MEIYKACKALIIGVSKYADPQCDLPYARPDAEALAELLGNEFGFNQVWTLYDQDATRQNLIRVTEGARDVLPKGNVLPWPTTLK